jgi:hypothetical protein
VTDNHPADHVVACGSRWRAHLAAGELHDTGYTDVRVRGKTLVVPATSGAWLADQVAAYVRERRLDVPADPEHHVQLATRPKRKENDR